MSIGLLGVLMLAMSVGVIFQRKPLRGSCGGVGGSCACADSGRKGACSTPEETAGASTIDEDGVSVYEPRA